MQAVKNAFKQGEKNAAVLSALAQEVMNALGIQYIELVDPVTLKAVNPVDEKTLLALAAFVGKTRLIDNGIIGEE